MSLGEGQSDPLALNGQEKGELSGEQDRTYMFCCVDNNKVRVNIFKLGCSHSTQIQYHQKQTQVCFGFAISRLAALYHDLLRYKSEIKYLTLPSLGD